MAASGAVAGRAGEFDRAAGFDGDRAATWQVRHGADDFGQLVPARAAHRVGQVEAVRLDLQADLADGSVPQALAADVQCGGIWRSETSGDFRPGAGP